MYSACQLHDRLVHCRELEYILIGDLRDLLDDPPCDETGQWLLAVLNTLLETLPQDFELSSQNGYLDSVLAEYPHWEPVVERLENQRYELYRRLISLRNKLQVNASYTALADMLKGELTTWMSAFKVLRQHEQRLVLLSTHLDEGAGG
ncbi:MAG: hypothetical protein KDA58_00830 [Planctomycetaceae bacterium]|nr:hypothetical protein [Planctomycetaceae bacterium]